MKDNERLILVAQIGIAGLFIIGYFTIFVLFMVGVVRVPEPLVNAFLVLLTGLGGFIGLIVSYFFQRQRSNTPPALTGSST